MKIETVAFDITNKCNLRCKHCYNYSGEHNRKSKELSDTEIKKILSDICTFTPQTICICGGEPLLRKDLLLECIKLIKEKSINKTLVNFVSNGYLLNERMAKSLKKAGVDLVQISLDGASSETHDWLRNREGAFDKAVAAIRNLKNNDITVAVAFTPTQKNSKDICKLLDLCADLKVKYFRSQPLMLMGRGKNLESKTLSNVEYFKLAEKIKKAKDLKKYSDMIIEWGDPLSHIKYFSNVVDHKLDCLNISAYGDIMLTPFIPVMIGNLKRYSIEQYIEAGIENIFNYKIIKDLLSLIDDWNKMQLNELNPLYPILGKDDNICLDIISNNLNNITLDSLLGHLKEEFD